MRIIKNRLGIIFMILVFSFSLLSLRLAYIQIINGNELRQKAFQLHNRYVNSEEFPRGEIVDSNGKSLINSGLEAREAVITNDRRVFVSKDPHELISVSNFGTNQMYDIPVIKRYGKDSLARHLIGHLSDGRGINGLERIYDDYLVSTPKYLCRFFLDGRGNIIPGLSFQIEERDIPRNRLVLTIQREVQEAVEYVMDKHKMSGAVVVMNPYNGDLLAVASRPNYDQNNLLVTHGSNLLNKAFQFYYPGSIFKILIMAAALEDEIVASNNRFNCNGAYIFPSGLNINCWNREGHGNINLIEAMAYSCNPAFIDIGLRLGRSKILKYTERLGLMKNTILGYPQNKVNNIHIDYGPGKIANASMGQEGIMITPVQMGILISSIANDGYVVTPRVVIEIQDKDGRTVKKTNSIPPYKIWSDSTVSALKDMLYAVNRWGTGINAWSSEVPSAGKTASAETGSGLNALFSGYFPLDEPKYVIVVVVEGGRSGGSDAAPIFKEIAEKITFE